MWWSVGSFCLAQYIGFGKNMEHLLWKASCHLAAHLHCPAPDLDQVCLLARHPALTLGRTLACGYKLAVIEDTVYSLLVSSTHRRWKLLWASEGSLTSSPLFCFSQHPLHSAQPGSWKHVLYRCFSMKRNAQCDFCFSKCFVVSPHPSLVPIQISN